MSSLDTGHAVRPGEELNLERLLPWLNDNIGELSGQPRVTQYSGGVSNWTYCLRFDNHEMILRRAPDGTKAKGAHDMQREHDLQRDLKPVFTAVPAVYGYCPDSSLIGSDFYVMEKLVGIIPRRNMPRALIVHGSGLDELALHGDTQVIEVENGQQKAYTVSPADFGLPTYHLKDIEGGEPEVNRALIADVLSGEGKPAHQAAIAMNAAALIQLSGLSNSFKDATEMAISSMHQGKPLATIQSAARISQADTTEH